MKIHELLFEAPELKSTINAVATDIGNTISNVYSKLDIMLNNYVKNHGSTEGFGFIGGGVGARWMAENGDRLISELHALAKQSRDQELHQYLLKREMRFFKLSRELPDILIQVGRKLRSDSLVQKSQAWKVQQAKYSRMLNGIDDAPAINTSNPTKKVDDTPKKQPSTIPSQNTAAEKIVNDILNKLNSGDAGEIRNAIARSPNKLLALQQELKKRNIQI